MKFIAELKDEELLPLVYNITAAVKEFCETTKVLEIRKTMPPEGKTAKEQGVDNAKEMLRVICTEYPAETANIARMLWVPEGTETDADKPNVLVSLGRFATTPWLFDFFASAMSLM